MNSNEHSALQSARETSSIAPSNSDRPGYIRPMSFTEAINKGNKTMLTIRKDGGFQNLTAWVMGRLVVLFRYLGAYDTEGGVTDFQIQMLAQRICAKYFYLTPGELDYFFVCFENGQYRKLFNNGKSVNPQDLMMSLVDYEKDLLEARGRAEEEKKRQEEAKQAAEDANKPHGLEAWKLYCESHGLDPDTHRIQSVKLHDVNEELYPERDENGIIKRTIDKIKRKL